MPLYNSCSGANKRTGWKLVNKRKRRGKKSTFAALKLPGQLQCFLLSVLPAFATQFKSNKRTQHKEIIPVTRETRTRKHASSPCPDFFFFFYCPLVRERRRKCKSSRSFYLIETPFSHCSTNRKCKSDLIVVSSFLKISVK